MRSARRLRGEADCIAPGPPPCARRASSPEPRRSGAAIDTVPRFPFPALCNARTIPGATPHPPGGARGSEQAPSRRRRAAPGPVERRPVSYRPGTSASAGRCHRRDREASPCRSARAPRYTPDEQCVCFRSNLLPDYAQSPACDPRRRKPRGRSHESPSIPQERESGSIEILGFLLTPRLRQDDGG